MIDGSQVDELRVLILDQGEGMWGAQQSLLHLAPLLEAVGIEQILAAPAGPLAEAWTSAGRRHVLAPAPRTRSIRGRSGRLSFWRAARELARTTRAGVRIAEIARANGVRVIVASNHWSHFEGVIAGRLGRLPVMLYLHEHQRGDSLGGLRRFAVKYAATTVAFSDSIRRALPASMWERVEVVRHGTVSPAAVSEAARDHLRTELGCEGRRVVLALARYEPEKGLGDLINAVAALPESFADVQLLLAGGSREDDSFEVTLRQLADQCLPGRVSFLGFREDAHALLALADVCVLPSYKEGFGLVALEAQASGCPLVAAAGGAIPEFVEHGVNGLLYPPGDVERLSAELARILADSDLRGHLSATGLARVGGDGGLVEQAASLARLLRSIT